MKKSEQGKFYDSYGKPVNHGCMIEIEKHYAYPQCNGIKAIVEWLPKQGMFAFRLCYKDSVSYGSVNFFGVNKFKVVDES